MTDQISGPAPTSAAEKIKCPFCKELICNDAIVCRFCHNPLSERASEQKGKFVSLRLKTRDKIYNGEVFVPQHLGRVSDVINDSRPFLLLSKAEEETKVSEHYLGFLAVNKNTIEWVRLLESSEESQPNLDVHI